MSSRPWSELDRPRRRRAVVNTVVAMALTWVLLVGIYYLIPFTDRTSGGPLVRLVLGGAAFVGVLVWQVRNILDAEVPGLRAVRALGALVPLFLLAFAAIYLSMSEASTATFSEPLGHTGALYLAVTVFSTVGFGDITPDSDTARLVVSAQMILDLVLIGALVRLLTTAAKVSRGGADAP